MTARNNKMNVQTCLWITRLWSSLQTKRSMVVLILSTRRLPILAPIPIDRQVNKRPQGVIRFAESTGTCNKYSVMFSTNRVKTIYIIPKKQKRCRNVTATNEVNHGHQGIFVDSFHSSRCYLITWTHECHSLVITQPQTNEHIFTHTIYDNLTFKMLKQTDRWSGCAVAAVTTSCRYT